MTDPLTTPPTAPARTQDKATFDANIEARMAWEATHVAEVNAILPTIDGAVAAAPAAIAAANAAKWISGETITEGDGRWSPTNHQSYRAKNDLSSGANTTDPANDATNWEKLSAKNPGGVILLSSASAASDAAIDFTGIDSTYDEYLCTLQNVILATDSANLRLLSSKNGGSSFDTAAGSYSWFSTRQNSGASGFSSAISGTSAGVNTEYISLAIAVGSDTNEFGVDGVIRLIRPSAASFTRMFFQTTYQDASGTLYQQYAAAQRLEADIVNAIRIVASNGNIESGELKFYGIDKTM